MATEAFAGAVEGWMVGEIPTNRKRESTGFNSGSRRVMPTLNCKGKPLPLGSAL